MGSDQFHPSHLATVVLPLLLPELPVFTWWRTPPFDQQVFDELTSVTDRLIVDSATSPTRWPTWAAWPGPSGRWRRPSPTAPEGVTPGGSCWPPLRRPRAAPGP